MCRPTSATTRRQPGSPSWASSTTFSMVSPAPWVGSSSGSTYRAAVKVSRQPRLPQRQTGPDSSRVMWPISPAVPPGPR